MVTVTSGFLGRIDRIRTIPDRRVGIRPYHVNVRVQEYSGGLDIGTPTVVETALVLADGARPKCRRVKFKETVAGGGKFQEGDWKLGPMTPEYSGGGITFDAMTPTRDGLNEVYYVVYGPDTGISGQPCNAVEIQADRALSRFLVLRPTGATL